MIETMTFDRPVRIQLISETDVMQAISDEMIATPGIVVGLVNSNPHAAQNKFKRGDSTYHEEDRVCRYPNGSYVVSGDSIETLGRCIFDVVVIVSSMADETLARKMMDRLLTRYPKRSIVITGMTYKTALRAYLVESSQVFNDSSKVLYSSRRHEI